MCAYFYTYLLEKMYFLNLKEYQNASNLFFQLLFAHNVESYIYGITDKKIFITTYLQQYIT